MCRARRRPSSGPAMQSRWGALTFSVVSGNTVAETIAIDLSPAVLTSDAIVISAGGVQAGFSATVQLDAGRVELHVPAGIGPGTVVHVEGLRVSIPASGIETLDARISTVENRLATGSRTAPGSSGESPTRSSSILRPIRSTPTPRAAYSSTISATSRSARGSRRRSLPQPRSSSRRRCCPETPNSDSRPRSNRKPAPA